METSGKSRFLLVNLLRGFIYLIALIGTFVFLWNYLDIDFHRLLEPVYEKPVAVYLVFLASEVIFGIIPPELFMIWASGAPYGISYTVYIILFALTSYLAGIIGYLFGSYLNKTRIYQYIERKALHKYVDILRKYGYFLLIVAALTPLPFSAICMLTGAVNYNLGRFLIFSAFRFIRFAAYSTVIFHTSSLWFLA